MLVLSRKRDEKILLQVPEGTSPQNIELTVVQIEGNRVRLGFEGDSTVTILRSELLHESTSNK